MAKYPGFLGPSYQSASYMAANERTVNFYLEKNETPNVETPYCLLPTPGFELLVTVAEGPIRGQIAGVNGRSFFVSGFRLYEVFADWTVTGRGTLAADVNPVTMCWNGPNGGQLFITSGDVGYILDLATNVLTTVLASGATMGAYLDGFFLALDAATATLQISDLLNGLVWDPTQVAQRTAGADPWVAMTVIHREIWLMGSQTSEVWYDAGTFPFPFGPIPGAFLEQGIVAPFSATRDVAPLLWVSANAQGSRLVLLASGYDGQRVSTHGVETALESYATIADATSFGYQDSGHMFYVLTFPTESKTWCYDVNEGAWHERPYWNTATSTEEALRVQTHAFAFGEHLVGDRTTGKLYRMALDVFTDVDGEALRRLRQPPRISMGQTRFTVQSVWLVMDVGVGLSGTEPTVGVDPQVMRRASRDGGKTWGPEKWMSAGKLGDYSTRVFWSPCGQARNYQDQFVFSDPVSFRIADAEIEITVGTS
jgi:hypothetical protein